jgi:ubiquinone/menaquinone biosynthesis C-methylase UbiE
MKESEFDQFADEYRSLHLSNIKLSGENPEFFAQYKIIDVSNKVRAIGIKADTILDFGCGIGNSIPFFREEMPGSALVCADISRKSLDLAQQRFPNQAGLHQIQNNSLNLPGQRFDILFSACVFHHIPHAEHIHWLGELRSVAKPGALLSIFEHNPLNPLTVRAVNTCPFDANARLIHSLQLKKAILDAGWSEAEIEYRIFFPNQLSGLRPLEKLLTWLPLGAQYVVYARA